MLSYQTDLECMSQSHIPRTLSLRVAKFSPHVSQLSIFLNSATEAASYFPNTRSWRKSAPVLSNEQKRRLNVALVIEVVSKLPLWGKETRQVVRFSGSKGLRGYTAYLNEKSGSHAPVSVIEFYRDGKFFL